MSNIIGDRLLRSDISYISTVTDSSISEGYDYEFIPSLDNKYMCPICLMALRDAVQTSCGHRFCKSCITKSLMLQKRCPVDNESLSEGGVFPDNYARREILDLIAKCPNKGCNHMCELRRMKEHSQVCPFRKVFCKHNCGLSLLVQDAIFHEENQCPNRPVVCDNCEKTYLFCDEETHKQECKQHHLVSCPHCKHKMKQHRLQQHLSEECTQAPLKCVFEKVGCQQQHSRHSMHQHMNESTQVHLQYLLLNISQVMDSNSDISSLIKDLSSRVQALENNNSYDTNDDNINIYERDGNGMANGYGNIPRGAKFIPPVEEKDEIQKLKEYNHKMELVNRSMSAMTCRERPDTSAAILNKDSEEKIIRLDHHVRELMAKMETQISSVKDLSSRLSSIEQKISHQELRCCNGLYFWKIKEYKRLRKAAITGEISVLHSPGFYTSPHGYKICIRVNLDGVENFQGTHLSLFVHIMKGENDDLLSWPFAGVITLTVINQKDHPHERSHISETLHAQSNLMAFQRPMAERNQKGYGYIDFFPLHMLESQGFIKNDTLIIKAHVRVDLPLAPSQ